MKIYQIIVTGSGDHSWYHSHVGEAFYATDTSLDGSEYLAIRSVDSPKFIDGCFFDKKHCVVVREFQGQIIPTNTVEIIDEGDFYA